MWYLYGFTTVSALLYGVAFWYPLHCWWGTLVSMVMLSGIHILSPANAFRCGFVWGLCAYAMQLYGIVIGIVTLANAQVWYAWLPGLFLVFYLALCTALFWCVGIWCEQFVPRVVWLALYWLWITYGCLFFCGRWEGHLLANPLIPWAVHPHFLWPVSWCGTAGATILLCTLSALVAYAINHTKYFCVCLILGIFFASAFLRQAEPVRNQVDWYHNVGVVTTPIIATVYAPSICHLIAEYIACVRAHDPHLYGIVFPESCIYPWQICAESILAEYVSEVGSCDYIIGSFYDDQGIYRNSCYWLRNGVLQKRFDKRHTMPLIERLPQFLQYNALKKLFFSTMPEIVPSTNERPVMQIGDIFFVPYICSELFFNRLPDDQHSDLPIVALINDRWAPPYLQELMYLGAVVQAYAWQREILYVSYTRYVWIIVAVHRRHCRPSDQS
jgi:hypothetical protein